MTTLLLAAILTAPATPQALPIPLPPRTGAEMLADQDFRILHGRRVGLVTNHTALLRQPDGSNVHLADALHQHPKIALTALFGPEHGIRGDADAGAKVDDAKDPSTGVPVFSLYGQTRKPTPAQLDNLDILVFDIQDIGARFYTYISTLGLCMQAAAEAKIPFLVLDRPNPLGRRADGFVLDPAHTSFVGQYPIPVQHGLTLGELARMAQGEAWLPGLSQLSLTVILAEWPETQIWPRLARPWIPPSPNIPTFETALVYPATCFIEGTIVSEGRGTREPFLTIGAPWVDAARLAQTLNEANLPGLSFAPTTFTPESIPGMSTSPKLLGKTCHGVKITVTNPEAVRPLPLAAHLVHALYHQAPTDLRPTFFNDRFFTLLAGGTSFQEAIPVASPNAIIASWSQGVREFETLRAPYLLYP